MCLIAFAWGASERFPFVIAANRDEFLARPTAALSAWTSAKGQTICSGRDLREGGTWMGFTARGRFAMLTNVRNPSAAAPEQPISRGRLVLDWLESEADVEDWAAALQATRFQGFNLILGDRARGSCAYLSNQGGASQATQDLLQLQHLSPGRVYGLSNAALDTEWPKTVFLKQSLQQALAQSSDTDSLTEQCLQALASEQAVADELLPRTGVPLDWERALASPFVRYPQAAPAQYGTRTSMVAALAAGHGLQLTEITHPAPQIQQAVAQISIPWR
jgi:uncharacterized protein with NRDE domain